MPSKGLSFTSRKEANISHLIATTNLHLLFSKGKVSNFNHLLYSYFCFFLRNVHNNYEHWSSFKFGICLLICLSLVRELGYEQTLITFLVFDFAYLMPSFRMDDMYNELLLQITISIYSYLKWKIDNLRSTNTSEKLYVRWILTPTLH